MTLYVPAGDASGEVSTLAMPIKELNQIKTADIPPTLLPDAKPDKDPQKTIQGATPFPASSPMLGKASGGSRWLWLGAGVLGLLLVSGTATWALWPKPHPRTVESSAMAPAETAPVPPELRPYMDQAKVGDAKAMHMIALMYWNGLNVRQDRVKGLEWYRKAATAGSVAAKDTLKVIEGQ